jgi:hypothetical protein
MASGESGGGGGGVRRVQRRRRLGRGPGVVQATAQVGPGVVKAAAQVRFGAMCGRFCWERMGLRGVLRGTGKSRDRMGSYERWRR